MSSLESSKLFNQLPAAEVARLKDTARELHYAAAQDIFRAGDPGDGVYVVKSGVVEISARLDSGERHGFSEVLPGDVFGEMTLLDNAPRSANATAKTDTAVYFVPRDHMLNLLRRLPELSMRLVQEVSERLREFNQQYLREVLQAERMALVGRFASSIVHDLKNPLCIIGLTAELMADAATTAPERVEAQARIAQQVERITHMVNDILEFTRGSTSVRPLAPMDYAAYVQSVVAEFQHELLLKSVTLQLANEPPAVRLAINPKRLNRVFNNLFGNAVDAMPNGGTIQLRFQASATDVRTEIADAGPGIPAEVAGRLFEAFVTFGKPKGTGLGLSITKKIIEEHAGTIRAFNPPSGGAVFAFTLPVPAA